MSTTGSMRAAIGTLIVATSIVQLANGFFGTFISLRVSLENFGATFAGLVLSSYFAGFTSTSTAFSTSWPPWRWRSRHGSAACARLRHCIRSGRSTSFPRKPRRSRMPRGTARTSPRPSVPSELPRQNVDPGAATSVARSPVPRVLLPGWPRAGWYSTSRRSAAAPCETDRRHRARRWPSWARARWATRRSSRTAWLPGPSSDPGSSRLPGMGVPDRRAARGGTPPQGVSSGYVRRSRARTNSNFPPSTMNSAQGRNW